ENVAPNDNAAGGGDIAAGQATYEASCTSCHGDPGMDNGPVASDIIGATAGEIADTLTGGAHVPVEGLDETDYADLGAFLTQDGDANDNAAGGVDLPYQQVEFDHGTHQEAQSCDTCHHRFDVSCDSSDCHASEWIAGVPNLKDAMHNPDGGCRGCHDTRTEDGLWDCSQCHTALNDL
ncbi:MAG: cytochrome c3 family protein, partial [Planctomycetota bacterium]